MWLKNYINEWKCWREVRKVYKQNQKEFNKIGLKSDWFGRLYKVINRDPSIALGTAKDEELLSQELKEISDFLIKLNVMDILAYELIPQEDSDKDTFENAYLIKLTPAYDMSKQYVTFGTTTCLILTSCAILAGLIYSIIHFIC